MSLVNSSTVSLFNLSSLKSCVNHNCNMFTNNVCFTMLQQSAFFILPFVMPPTKAKDEIINIAESVLPKLLINFGLSTIFSRHFTQHAFLEIGLLERIKLMFLRAIALFIIRKISIFPIYDMPFLIPYNKIAVFNL